MRGSRFRYAVSGIAALALVAAVGVGAFALARSGDPVPGGDDAAATITDDSPVLGDVGAAREDAPDGDGRHRAGPPGGDDRVALPPEETRPRAGRDDADRLDGDDGEDDVEEPRLQTG